MELIPIAQVLDDMYSDKGVVSWAARDYYKMFYATPEEIKQLNREEKIETVVAFSIFGFIVFGTIAAVLINVFCK